MRIAISGTASQGKTTLIKDFLAEWPIFQTESQTYRQLITEENLPHSKNATKYGQFKILNHMIDELQKYGPNDNVIFDRCPLDNLVYSLWCFENRAGDIDKEFIDMCIPLVRESMRHLDIIFFLPITKVAPVPIEEDKMRESDPIYIAEIDNIFKAMEAQWKHGLGKTPFFPADDSPAVIEIFGNRQERIQLIKYYINSRGELIGGDVEDPNNILNPDNIKALEDLLIDQKHQHKKETEYKGELKKIADFVKGKKKISRRY